MKFGPTTCLKPASKGSKRKSDYLMIRKSPQGIGIYYVSALLYYMQGPIFLSKSKTVPEHQKNLSVHKIHEL